MDTLKKLFCCCPRTIKYYIENDKNSVDFENMVTQKFNHVNFEQARKKEEENNDMDEVRDPISNRKNIIFG